MHNCLRTFSCFTFLLLLFSYTGRKALAATGDSLKIYHKGKNVFILYEVDKKETITSIAKRFKAPIALVMDLNKADYSTTLKNGQQIKVPIGNYNLVKNSRQPGEWLYYKVQTGEQLFALSRLFDIPASTIKQWNGLKYEGLFTGQILKIGKLDQSSALIKQPVAISETKEDRPPKIVASPKPDLDTPSHNSELETTFHQVNNGQQLTEISGAVEFFVSNLTRGHHHFALFNEAPRGSIISVYNPSTRKVIYAKVIGNIPEIGKYHNAILGLSNSAKKALGVKDKRAFCRVKY